MLPCEEGLWMRLYCPGMTSNPGDPSGRVSQNTGVTPAVSGLSRDNYPIPWTLLSECCPELHRQSPGTIYLVFLNLVSECLSEGSQGLGSHPETAPVGYSDRGVPGVVNSGVLGYSARGDTRGWVVIPG